MPGRPPAPADSPSIWSRTRARTPPCTSVGRALVRRPEVEVAPDAAVGGLVVLGDQGRGDRVAQADDGVAPGAAAAVGAVADAVRAGSCRARRRAVIASTSAWARADLVVVDGGADGRVDQLAHGVGERPVERGLARDLLLGQVVAHEATGHGRHPRTRSRSSCRRGISGCGRTARCFDAAMASTALALPDVRLAASWAATLREFGTTYPHGSGVDPDAPPPLDEAGCAAFVADRLRYADPAPGLPRRPGALHLLLAARRTGATSGRVPRGAPRPQRLPARAGRSHRLLRAAVGPAAGPRGAGAAARSRPRRRARSRPGPADLRARQRGVAAHHRARRWRATRTPAPAGSGSGSRRSGRGADGDARALR